VPACTGRRDARSLPGWNELTGTRAESGDAHERTLELAQGDRPTDRAGVARAGGGLRHRAADLIGGAATLYRTDRFSITDEHFDFGDGNLNNITGRPTEISRLDWILDAGEWEPTVIGRTYINNASGDCVRLQMVVGLCTGVATYNKSGGAHPTARRGGAT
jgi:hypothetical protein